MNIDERYRRLLDRRVPLDEQNLIKEAYEQVKGKNTAYIIGAMAPVGESRTTRLQEQGTRVENQLLTRLAAEYPGLQFRRQGSVSNHTHIRYYSDVDVLVIIDKFHDLQHPLQPAIPYKGDVVDDLLTLRKRCAEELAKAFPAVTIDDSGSTAVNLSGGSLACSVDAVPSSWLHTVAFNEGQGEHTRGIKVINKFTNERKANYPFLFNYRLQNHDSNNSGVPRLLIRLLKSIREDHLKENPSKTIAFSSFDICSLIYRMPASHLSAAIDHPLSIVRNCLLWLSEVVGSQALQQSLSVIDDTRIIFDTDQKLPGLQIIHKDLFNIYQSAVAEQAGHEITSRAHLAA